MSDNEIDPNLTSMQSNRFVVMEDGNEIWSGEPWQFAALMSGMSRENMTINGVPGWRMVSAWFPDDGENQ